MPDNRPPNAFSPQEVRRAIARLNLNSTNYDSRLETVEAWPAGDITAGQITNWDTAYSWGDHAMAGYALAADVVPYTGATGSVDLGSHDITTTGTVTGINVTSGADPGHTHTAYVAAESDPIVGAVNGIVKADGAGAISAASAGTDYLAPAGDGSALTGLTWSQIGSTPTTLAGYGITDAQPLDADLTAIAALSDTGGWAKRTGAGIWAISTPSAADVGADPAGTAAAVVSSHESTYNHANYNTAYGWGDHAGLYDATGTASGLVGTHESTYNHANYNTAYGWGDHAGLYTPIAHKTTEDALNGLVKCDGAGNYSAVADSSANWNTAYGWGDHAGLYDAAGTAAAAVSSHQSTYNHANYDTAYGWGNHASGGYLKADGTVALTGHWDAGPKYIYTQAGFVLNTDGARLYLGAGWDTNLYFDGSRLVLDAGSYNTRIPNGNFMVGGLGTASGLISSKLLSSSTASNLVAIHSSVGYGAAGSGNMSNNLYGLFFEASTVAAYDGDITGELIGCTGTVSHYGSGALSLIYGIKCEVFIRAGGGNVTDAYGAKLFILDQSSAGAITNSYGLYIEDVSGATTLNYAIYTNAGDVRLGDDTEVVGTLQAGGYKSSDGTPGDTADVAVAKVGGGTRTLTFKNGLYTGYADS